MQTKSLVQLGVIMAGLLASSSALAQQASQVMPGTQDPPVETKGLEDIVVTATRSETVLQRTPIAISAFSGQVLQERGVKSLLDVANYTPSLSIGGRAGQGAAGGGGVTLRGIGVDSFDSSPSVGVYLDDVYYASARGNLLGLLDVNRIEVLRGPQGTLFGRNTIAGAIQYVTNDPNGDLSAQVTGTVGNRHRGTVQGYVNLPIAPNLNLRISGIHDHRGGFVYDELNDIKRGAETTNGVRGKLRWEPTDRLTIDLKGEYSRLTTNGRPVTVGAVNPLAQFVLVAQLFGETRPLDNSYISPSRYSSRGFNAPDFARSHYTIAQAEVVYQLTDVLSIKSISAKAWYRSRLDQDFDQTPLAILASDWIDNSDVFTQELQLRGTAFDGKLRFTLGGFYFDSKRRQVQPLTLGFGPALELNGRPLNKVRSEAAYGSVSYNFTDRLSADVGLRYSHETNKSNLIGQTSPTNTSFNDVSPSFGLNFQATEDMLFYAKASKGFRAGGFSPSAQVPGGGASFGPETAWTYEVGARLDLFNKRVRLNPTVFYTKWKNIQFNRLSSGTTAFVTANAGDARIKGAELEGQVVATDRLRFNGSLSLLRSHYTRVDYIPFVFAGPPIVADITVDTPLQRAPRTKFSVGAQYTMPVGDGSLAANADYAWTARQYTGVVISQNYLIPSFGLLNARVQYTAPHDRFTIAVFGTNLTNKYYLVGAGEFAKGFTSGVRELDPGRPREFGVEGTIRF